MINKKLIEIIEGYGAPFDMPINGLECVSLYHDMGIYGDDVDYLFDEYINTFDVTVPTFCFCDYFPDERTVDLEEFRFFIANIFRFIFTGKKAKRNDGELYKRLTIGDLQIGIDTGILEL